MDNSHYTGITTNLPRRIIEHKKGYSKSTKFKGSFEIVFKFEFVDRKSARMIEVKIKKMRAGIFLSKNNLHKITPQF